MSVGSCIVGRTFVHDVRESWDEAYISLDLTGVRQQGQQAKGGGSAEGRMPYVAMVFNPVPELPDDSPHRPPPKARMQARNLSGLYDLKQLGIELRKQAGHVGMDKAETWIGLTDGGNGLEEFVRRNFSRDPVQCSTGQEIPLQSIFLVVRYTNLALGFR